jgi:hypothetical protein
MMFLKERRAAFAAVIGALAIAVPVTLASAASAPVADPIITGPSCPVGYSGPTNLATGCPWWMMTYSVQYPGQQPVRCPPGWSPPSAVPALARARAAAAGSAGRAPNECAGVAGAE